MPKLPREPDRARLAALEPAIRRVRAGTPLYRVYARGGPYPTSWRQFRYFGPVSRFDHQERDESGDALLQERGTLYAAGDVATAIAETFQRNRRRIDTRHSAPWLVAFELAEDVTLLDLSGTFALRAGASMKLVSGPFSFSQAWARGFYEAYEIDGIHYPSSLTNRPNVVLFERADDGASLPDTPLLNRALADPVLAVPLRAIAENVGYRLS